MRRAILLACLLIAASPMPTVRIVTPDQRASCQYLGLVSAERSMGMNKSRRALEAAMRKVADLGGNGLFVIGQSKELLEGAEVNGEALKCPA